MRRRSIRLGARLAAGAVLAGVGAPACGGKPRSGVLGGEHSVIAAARPRAAAAFGNSFGVNVHLFYGDTPYRRIALVARRLRGLHIRHIRDGLAPNRPDEVAALRLLARSGVRADLLLGTPGADPAPLLDLVESRLLDSVEAIEGPNEYWRTGGDWKTRLRAFELRLGAEVRRRPALDSQVLVDSSSGVVPGTEGFGIGNIHPYPGGREPEDAIGAAVSAIRRSLPAEPVWATETGYHDALHAAFGAASGQPPVSDAAQAVYVPRIFASYFAADVQRTYLYELLDEFPDPGLLDPEKHFGLLDWSLRPKPQYRALARLVEAIRDPGASRAPRPLRYELVDQGHALRQLLLSRSDGTWQLLLWRAEPVDADGRPVDAPAAVEVRLPRAMTTRVVRLTGLDGEAPRAPSAAVDLDVGAELVVVDITPGVER